MIVRRVLLLWLIVVAVALSIHIGSYPLYDADEGRNAEVGREMAETNDYVMPRLDGMPYLDKPIVYFAAEAAAMEVLGPTEVAARLPALLFTFATAAIVFWFAKKVWGSEDGLIAAIAYLSMPLTLAFSRTVIFDSALAFFMVAAIIAFYFAVESAAAHERSWRWTVLAWAAMGFGVLTKGPVAIAVPLIVAIPYAINRKQFRSLWSWLGLVAFVLVIAPWVWAISQAVPDFLEYVLVTETAQRMATKALKRTGAPWYFVPYVLGGALPWSVLAMFAWRKGNRGADRSVCATHGDQCGTDTPVCVPRIIRGNPALFVALWILVPFIFFSISQSKRPQYILPVMPAIGLAVALFWRGGERRGVAVRVAAVVLLTLGIAVAAAPSIVEQRSKVEPEIKSGIAAAAVPMAMAMIGGALFALVFARRKEVAIAALSLPIIAIPATSNPLMQSIGTRRSAQSLVQQMKPHLTPDTEVVGIEAYTGSMSFYLQRTITVATPDGEEFTSNYIIRHYPGFADDPASSLRRPEWLQKNLDSCCTPRIYVMRSKDKRTQSLLASRGMRPIASDGHFVAYGPWRGPNRMH